MTLIRTCSSLAVLLCAATITGLAAARPLAAEPAPCALRVAHVVPQDRLTYAIRLHATSIRTQDVTLTPYAPAGLTRPKLPEFPEIAAQQGARGSVFLAILVGSDGSMFAADVVASSRNRFLDGAGRQAASESIYEPAVFRCQRVVGVVTVRADFTTTPDFSVRQTQLSAQ